MVLQLDYVAREVVRAGGPSALSVPMAQVLAGMRNDAARMMLAGLRSAASAQTLEQLFASPEAAQRFEKAPNRAAQANVLNELTRWAHSHAQEEKQRGIEKASAVKQVEEHELTRWAERLGVEDRLGDPLSELASFVDGDRWTQDGVRFYGTGDVRKAALGRATARGVSATQLRDAARKYLEAASVDSQRESRRQALWAKEPEVATLARLSTIIRGQHDELARTSKLRPARVPDDALSLDPAVPALEMTDPLRNEKLSLRLSGHEQGRIEIAPRHPRVEAVLALLRLALDVLHDPQHRLRADLVRTLEAPTWARLVSSVEADLAEAHANDEVTRVVFRINVDGSGTPRLDVAIQKRGKGGRWGKGTRTNGFELRSRHSLTPAQRLALGVLDHPGAAWTPEASALALHALVGTDCVVLGEEANAEPLEVRLVEPRFAFAEGEDGARAGLALGPVVVSPASLMERLEARATVIAHVDAARRVVLVAAIDPVLARIVVRAAQYPAAIPREQASTLLPFVERVAAHVPVTLPAAMEAEIAECVPRYIVRIHPDDTGAIAEIRARVSGMLTHIAGAGPTLVSVLEEGTALPVLRRRDLDKERHAAHEIARSIGMPEGEVHARLASDEAIVTVLEGLAQRPDIDVEWPDGAARQRFVGTMNGKKLSVRVMSAAEWFGVEGEIEIDGEKVQLAELLAAVRAGRRFVKVGPGRFAAIAEDLRARLDRAADVVFDAGKGALSVVPAAGDAIEELAREGTLQVDDSWGRIRSRLLTGALEEPPVPATVQATLRDYQRAGFAWMARLASIESGAVLADDMGLGKTVQALTLLAHRAELGPALVVAPTSVVDNWAREAARFVPSLRVRVLRGTGRHAALGADEPRAGDLLLASYDIVALDAERLAEIELATLVLDEAQAVKNPDAQRTQAVRSLHARVRIALTGTPLENRLSELWSLMSIVHPGLLGTWPHFRGRFATPIERDGHRERLAALSSLVRPYVLRRTKEVVTPELPPRIELMREVELSEAERRLYDAERESAIAALASADESQRFQVLASITRLRQLACDAELVVPGSGVVSSKVAALLELVEELEAAGRKVLVFSQFVRLLDRVATQLSARSTTFLRLDGSTPADERARRVASFQAGEASVFLLSLKAGGTGLNLTAADHVVHLDPWWNPAVEDQASDRAHRIGQDKPVTIVRLVAKGTIEEAVLSLHEEKRALTRGVLEGADAAGALSAQDLVELIRTGASERGIALPDVVSVAKKRGRPPATRVTS